MRFRPTFMQLESRENPSVPALDPFGGTAPAPVEEPTTTDPVQVAVDAVIAGASATTTTTTTAPTTDPLLINNSIYNVPLVP